MKHIHRPKQTGVVDELTEYRSVERKKLLFTMLITGAMMAVEVVGGLVTRSLALVSDAGHMFTHFFALAISLGAILYANKPSCHHRTFGFYRIEILSALFNSLFLFTVSAWILWEGIRRIVHPVPVLGTQMFWIALAGLIVNFISVWILHGADKKDLNVKGAFLHMLADTFSSVVIVAGAVVISFTGWYLIDPVLSILIALMICVWGWGLFKDSVNVLLEAAPKGLTIDLVSEVLKKEIPLIEEITDLHLWVITSHMYSMTAHIKLTKGIGPQEERAVLNGIKRIVDERFDIEHTTIEIDPSPEGVLINR